MFAIKVAAPEVTMVVSVIVSCLPLIWFWTFPKALKILSVAEIVPPVTDKPVSNLLVTLASVTIPDTVVLYAIGLPDIAIGIILASATAPGSAVKSFK